LPQEAFDSLLVSGHYTKAAAARRKRRATAQGASARVEQLQGEGEVARRECLHLCLRVAVLAHNARNGKAVALCRCERRERRRKQVGKCIALRVDNQIRSHSYALRPRRKDRGNEWCH
jgi:hypothetical protein